MNGTHIVGRSLFSGAYLITGQVFPFFSVCDFYSSKKERHAHQS